MTEHIRNPLETVQEVRGEITRTCRNEIGEEYTHSADTLLDLPGEETEEEPDDSENNKAA